MRGAGVLLAGWLLILGETLADHLYRSGRRICSSRVQTGAASVTESFIQPVYHPLITLCEGQRVCSTYRTVYKISYRQVTQQMPRPLYSCCPGWRRTGGPQHGCSRASCQLPCRNGGTCIGANRCECPAGWTGPRCQTDVDECNAGRHQCSQICANTAGGFSCSCRDGYQLSGNGKSCDTVEKPPITQSTPLHPTNQGTGVPDSVRQEMQELRDKINSIEQKLQLVLAPFYGLSTASPEDGLGPIAYLAHSFQQLDRIESLSEQISFLEERLETCSCKNDV